MEQRRDRDDLRGSFSECAEIRDLLQLPRVYADGVSISCRRREKANLLAAAIREHAPEGPGLRACDFGCADAAIPKLLLQSEVGPRLEEYVGITLLHYNQQWPKRFHFHPRLTVRFGDLEKPIPHILPDLAPASFDVITATGFFPYLERPQRGLKNAAWLLRRGGILLTMIPVGWVLRLRRSRWFAPAQRNRYIRSELPPATFLPWARSLGFLPLKVTRVQLTGLDWPPVRWLEQALEGSGLMAWIGTNHFFIHVFRG